MTQPLFTLREGRPSDLNAILALDRASDTGPHWPPSVYESVLAQTGAPSLQRFLVVAEIAHSETESLAGFAVAALPRVPPEVAAELEDVIVASDLRRAGIGRALCRTTIEWARTHGATSILLEVRAASTGAIALYTALGFRQSGRRPRYYCDPEDDAILMHLACGQEAYSEIPASDYAVVTFPRGPSSSPA